MTAFIAIPRDAEHRDELLRQRRFSDAAFYIVGRPGECIHELAKKVPRNTTIIITPDGEYHPEEVDDPPVAVAAVNPVEVAKRDDICAVTCFFNPVGFKSLRRNYELFRQELQRQGVPLVTVEMAIGDNSHSIEPDHEKVVHVRGRDVLFAKENLLNIGFNHVPEKFSKVAFLDCDMLWAADDWLSHASVLLDNRKAVQLFSDIFHAGRNGAVLHHGPGEAKRREQRIAGWGAPGAGWAVHRDFIQFAGGLYDKCVVGAGDMIHTHLGFYGEMNHPYTRQLAPEILDDARTWATRAHVSIRGNCAFVPTRMTHMFHGDRSERQYYERHAIIGAASPDWVEYNADGVLEWSRKAPESIRDDMVKYFTDRNEDA